MSEAEDRIPPGHLSGESRAAAIQAAIGLLGSYFADAPTWELERRRDVVTGSTEDDELTQALRLRVALAAARKLDLLLHEIAAELSFRYRRVAGETVGMLGGRLDTQRYLRSQGRRQAPRRYPVTIIERSHATPENILALYATGWVLRELDIGDAVVVPHNAPERREIRERRASLARTLNHPVLGEARVLADRVWRHGTRDDLLDQVQARVEGGHLARPEPYGALAHWVRTFDPRALPHAGNVEWSFYDERFDTKLFEIWMLDKLARALTPKLGLASTRPLWDRGVNPTFLWKQGPATVALHFQRALSSGSGGAVWQRIDPPAPLDGVPDITVVVTTTRSGESLAYIDAKLRQRDQHPTEELYKLLGYFDNTRDRGARHGAIVYYKPDGLAIEAFSDQADGGRMLSIGVEPSSASYEAGFVRVSDLVLEMLTTSDPDAFESPATEETLDDSAISAMQEKAVGDLLLRAVGLTRGTLDPYRHLLSSQIPSTWPRLDADLQTILVTAEYFGAAAPEGADLSGPLLGLAAACEWLLCAEHMLFDRVAGQCPAVVRRPVTLGSAARFLGLCQRPKTVEHQSVQRAVRGDPQIDYDALLAVGPDLASLNRLRRAAAHIELVSHVSYTVGRTLVLGAGDEAKSGLLARLVQALGVG